MWYVSGYFHAFLLYIYFLCGGPICNCCLQEMGKQPGSMLASRLKIRGEEYEDLDEIISRRVSACNDLVNDLLSSNKVCLVLPVSCLAG